MSEDKTKKPVSKELFLDAFAAFMKSRGVVFKTGEKAISRSRDLYWDLFKSVVIFLEAAAACSGSSVSLSGVGVAQFKEVGRTEESRSYRFRFAPSSAVTKFFNENQDLVLHENLTEEEFKAKVEELIALMAPAKTTDTADGTEVETVEELEESEAVSSDGVYESVDEDSDLI